MGTCLTLRMTAPGAAFRLMLTSLRTRAKPVAAPLFSSLLACSLFASYSVAATKTWNGTPAGLWSGTANWSPPGAPASGDDVVFNPAVSISSCIADSVADDLRSITLLDSYNGTVVFKKNFVNGGSTITLTGALTVSSGTILIEGDTTTWHNGINDGNGITIIASTITVNANGWISADGQGFTPERGPGRGTFGAAGAAHGGKSERSNSTTYGSAETPTSLGSGGYASYEDAPGGGAIRLLASNTIRVDGKVSANGLFLYLSGFTGGGGSGGSLLLEASRLEGSGTFEARGGSVIGPDWGSGGGGRISLVNISSYAFSGTLSVNGGEHGRRGYAGTIMFPQVVMADFVLNNRLRLGNDIEYSFGNLTISSGAVLELDGDPFADGGKGIGLTIRASTITVKAGGAISADGLGFSTQIGPGAGEQNYYPGGTHGGAGGGNLKARYGSATDPRNFGSGGGGYSGDWGGRGGGAIVLVATYTVTINGKLSANGMSGHTIFSGGGGAGGSVLIYAQKLMGSGRIYAEGGSGNTSGGGGGRISLVNVDNFAFSGPFSVKGGTGTYRGFAGTITFPDQLMQNFGLHGTLRLGNDIEYSFGRLVIYDGGVLEMDGDPNGNDGKGSGGTIRASTITINTWGAVSANGLGFSAYRGAGAFGGNRSGGTYGGKGGNSQKAVYGSALKPVVLGSAGLGGGGGSILIYTTYTFTISPGASLTANGEDTDDFMDGAGSGGSIYIHTHDLSGGPGLGSIRADGGSALNGADNGGGGGRVYILYTGSNTFIGVTTAAGGGGEFPGQNGTFVVQSNAEPAGVLDLAAQTGAQYGTIRLSWTAPMDDALGGAAVSSYDVRYATYVFSQSNWNAAGMRQAAGEPAPSAPGTLETMTLSGDFAAGTTYYFAIRSKDNANNTSPLDDLSLSARQAFALPQPDLGPPGAVTDLAAVIGSGSGNIVLSWTAPGDDDRTGDIIDGRLQLAVSTEPVLGGLDPLNYALGTATNAPAGVTIIQVSTATAPGAGQSYTFAGLPQQATYYFRVWTRDELTWNWSPASNEAAADRIPPSAISDLEAVPLTSSRALLSWSAAGDNGPDGSISGGWYRIDYSSYPAHVFSSSTFIAEFSTDTAPGATEFYIADGLFPCATYYFRVYTGDEVPNWSPGSNAAAAQALSTIPPAASVVTDGTGTFTVDIIPGGNPLPAEFSVGVDADGDSISFNTTSYLQNDGFIAPSPFWQTDPAWGSAVAAGFSANKLVRFKVRSRNSSGAESLYSDETVRYSLALPPTGFNLVDVAITSVTVQWAANTNPSGTSYRIKYWEAGGSTITATVSVTGATIADLMGLSSYFFAVCALNGDNTESCPDATLSTATVSGGAVNIGPNEQKTLVFNIPSGQGQIEIPVRAFSEQVAFTVRQPSSLPAAVSPVVPLQGTGVGIEVVSDKNIQPSREVYIYVPYMDTDITGLDENRLVLARYIPERNYWLPLVSVVDTVTNLVRGTADHFSLFQIMQGSPSSSVKSVKIFPNPLRPARGDAAMVFSGLPATASLRIYSLKGELIREETTDALGMARWDGRNRSGRYVASGVYFVFVEKGGDKKTFKVAVQR